MESNVANNSVISVVVGRVYHRLCAKRTHSINSTIAAVSSTQYDITYSLLVGLVAGNSSAASPKHVKLHYYIRLSRVTLSCKFIG